MSEWISVKDRLPEANHVELPVDIKLVDGSILRNCTLQYNESWYWNFNDEFFNLSVTHWRQSKDDK